MAASKATRPSYRPRFRTAIAVAFSFVCILSGASSDRVAAQSSQPTHGAIIDGRFNVHEAPAPPSPWIFDIPDLTVSADSTTFDPFKRDLPEAAPEPAPPSLRVQVFSPTLPQLPDDNGVQNAVHFDNGASGVEQATAISDRKIEDSDSSSDTAGLNRVPRSSTATVQLAARQPDETSTTAEVSELPASATEPATATENAVAPPTNANVPAAGSASPAVSATPSTNSIESPISIELVELRKQQLATSTDLEASVRDELIKHYDMILAELQLRNEREKKAKEFSAKAEAAPGAIADYKRRKENPPKLESMTTFALRTSKQEDLQSMLQQQQTAMQSIIDAKSSIDTAVAAREVQKGKIPRLISEEKALQAKITEDLAARSNGDANPQISEAKNTLLRARLSASMEQVRMLEQEMRAYQAETELLPLQKEVLAVDEKLLNAKIKEITAELESRRETKIDSYRKFAESILANSPSASDRASAENMIRAWLEWRKIVLEDRKIQLELEQSQARYELWDERKKEMTSRIDSRTKKSSGNQLGGLNSWIGLMLRRQRTELPSLRLLQQQLEGYQTRMQDVDRLNLELNDWKSRQSALKEGSSEELSKVQEKEIELINDFQKDADDFFNDLINISDRKAEMIKLVEAYRQIIDQHVLWIRSTEPINKSYAQQLWPALSWICDFDSWKMVGIALVAEFRARLTESILFVIGWIVLVFNTRKMRNKIREAGEAASKSSNMRYLPTFQTVLLTLLISSPWPALMAYIGLRLYGAHNAQPFVQQFGFGLAIAARFFFVIEVLRQVCRAGGLAEKHLNWASGATALFRRHLRWFIDLSLPLVAIVAMVFEGGDEVWENSLGRFAYIILMVISAFAIAKIFHPTHGALREYIARHGGGWADRLRYVWFIGLVSIPLLLACGSALGYHYTSVRLAILCHRTAMTMVGIFIVYCLATRWLLLSRRRLAIAQARQRLEDAQRETANTPVASGMHDVRSTEFRNEMRNEQNSVDLVAINAQTMRLVSACAVVAAMVSFSLIWSDVLPAVNALDRVQIWDIKDAAGTVTEVITLSNVLFAIPIAVLTAFAARNLPGLLEIALLQHLPIENAVRYAITTVSRYALLMVGIAMTFNYIGVRWSSIQWLVAALGVGLGFGLQEIFANFVSGLILLFEQPIRVGDVVTIGDTSGAIAKIRMRATTITNWDRQELIVPNKDLITGRLLNWTLSDSTNRTVITVGIAYGSDTELACKILLDACAAHPNVLVDPTPTAFFENFADSTLQITLRFFLQTLDQRLQTRHELLTTINKMFSEAGIEIAFPQRDLHLRSLPVSLTDYLSRSNLSLDQANQTQNGSVSNSVGQTSK